MALFCMECWNEINKGNENRKKYIFSKDLELCEGCGEWKKVVIAEKKFYYLYKLYCLVLPFRFIYKIIYFLCRVLMLPYLIYMRYRKKANN